MKSRLALSLALLLGMAALSGCSVYGDSAQEEIQQALKLDLSAGEVILQRDDHAGAHGDGTAFMALCFSDESLLKQIAGNGEWTALPLSQSLTALVYGVTDTAEGISTRTGPFLADEEGKPLLPQIQNGYYYFLDRHSESRDGRDDPEILERSSFNFTIAVYDADTNTLYYGETDT